MVKHPNLTQESYDNFESHLQEIEYEISKHKNKWTLASVAWLGWEDVAQIILIHIYKKWGQYDPQKPLKPWINIIITNQIRNLVRNNYTNYARPCLRCDASIDNDSCQIYDEQGESCPLFAYWKQHKQPATFVKLPLSIENHLHEVHEIKDNSSLIFREEKRFHVIMKRILKPMEYQVYEGLYILHKSDAEVAKSLGFISNEKGRTPGYRQLKNIQKSIIQKAKKHLKEEGLE